MQNIESEEGQDELLALDYFVGGVPALAIFAGPLEDLCASPMLN